MPAKAKRAKTPRAVYAVVDRDGDWMSYWQDRAGAAWDRSTRLPETDYRIVRYVPAPRREKGKR